MPVSSASPRLDLWIFTPPEAGGSAGGRIAACTAFIDEFDGPGEDGRVSAVPNALVLFNPALVLAPLPGLDLKGAFGAGVPASRCRFEGR